MIAYCVVHKVSAIIMKMAKALSKKSSLKEILLTSLVFSFIGLAISPIFLLISWTIIPYIVLLYNHTPGTAGLEVFFFIIGFTLICSCIWALVLGFWVMRQMKNRWYALTVPLMYYGYYALVWLYFVIRDSFQKI